MGRLPSWLIVAAVGVLVALAAADAIRSRSEGAPSAPEQQEPASPALADLHGQIVLARVDCDAVALRLPSLVRETPEYPACGGRVWSLDGTASAICVGNVTEVTLAVQVGVSPLRLKGCAPAWRPDGAVSVVRNGDLVVARRRGTPQILVSRKPLAAALAGVLEGGRTYELVEVAWIGRSSFAAIVSGSKPWQQAVIVYGQDGLENVISQFGQHISSLRVSPLGNLAVAHNQAGREFVMFTRSGEEMQLPRIANARAIAWSTNEEWVALATRTTTFFARTNSRRTVARIPFGGDSMDWRS